MVVSHCTTEGSAKDFSFVVVLHVSLKDAVVYGAYVYHTVLEGAFLDGAFVSHVARKGAVIDDAVVCHFFISGEGTVIDGAPVSHFSIEGAVRYGAFGAFVYHLSIEGAFLDGVAVCHSSIEDAVRDCSAESVPCSVVHCCIEGAAGNFRRRFNLNRTRHSRIGRFFIGRVLGIGQTEIKLSIRQSQCLGSGIITPVVADIHIITIRVFCCGHIGGVRQTVLHDELWGVCCKGPQGEHGEHHAQCEDQAENAFFHRDRPPFLPKAAPKAARSFVSESIIP